MRRFAAFCGVLRRFVAFCGVLRRFAAFCGALAINFCCRTKYLGGSNPRPLFWLVENDRAKMGGQWPRFPPENIFLVSSREHEHNHLNSTSSTSIPQRPKIKRKVQKIEKTSTVTSQKARAPHRHQPQTTKSNVKTAKSFPPKHKQI
jgi:hypothetical protein